MMQIHSTETLYSQQDASVNFIMKGNFPGSLEARYVRRAPHYFVAYLSSQSGCKQACRMCHLTATGQVDLENANAEIFMEQARTVLDYYKARVALYGDDERAEIVNFGFMARGEPLANPFMLSEGSVILDQLGKLARTYGLFPRFNISTILPDAIHDRRLTDIFSYVHPDFYYSIYSVNPTFRKKWLRNAMSPMEGLTKLAEYQAYTRKIPKLHWCFIEGENDSEEDVKGICDMVRGIGLRVDVNIVRYNPYSPNFGRESSEDVVTRNFRLIVSELSEDTRVKVVGRVGFDVKASCGMFVPPAAASKIG